MRREPSKREPFDVVIQVPRGGSMPLRVDPLSSIGNMKGLIAEKEGLPVDLLKFVCSGIALDDDRTLEDYRIAKQSALILTTTEPRLTLSIQISQDKKESINKHIVTLSKFEPVYRIKENIQKTIGIPFIKQKLSFKSQVLEDARTLESYGIVENADLTFEVGTGIDSNLYVKTIKGPIKGFRFDEKNNKNASIKELSDEVAEVEQMPRGLFDLKLDEKILKITYPLSYIAQGSLLISEYKMEVDVVLVDLDAKAKELIDTYEKELSPFLTEVNKMEIKDIEKMFEKRSLIIEKAKDLSILTGNVKYNKEHASIIKAREINAVLKVKYQDPIRRLMVAKNNSMNLFKIVSQTFQKISNKHNSETAKNKGKSTVLKFKKKLERILDRAKTFKQDTDSKIVPLVSRFANVNKEIESLMAFLSKIEKHVDDKTKDYKYYLKISKDLLLVNTPAEECLQEVKDEKIDTVREESLYDITGIAKAVSVDQRTLLSEEEKELNNRIEKPAQIPETWKAAAKEEIKEPVQETKETREAANEFSMRLIKKGLEDENREVIITQSHRMSTLNIHNVHLLSSTYSNSQKVKIRLKDSAGIPGKDIFTDGKTKAEFLLMNKEKIAKELGVDVKYVSIVDMLRGSIILSVVLDLNPEDRELAGKLSDKTQEALSDVTREKFKSKLYEIYDKHIMDLHSEDIFSTFMFDANYLEPDYDFEYTEKHNEKDKRGRFPYYLPIGFRRLGIKVKGVYENDDWIDKRGSKGWAVGYHGISAKGGLFNDENKPDPNRAMNDAVEVIRKTHSRKIGFEEAKRQGHGQGVYCTPDVRVAEEFAAVSRLDLGDGKKLEYKLVFQCRIRSDVTFAYSKNQSRQGSEDIFVIQDKGTVGKHSNDYWLIRDPKNVRPYGILIKMLKK